MRGQNAADAAAYSVANVVARDLNFIASTNRIMVAHQGATGQFVGLASYSNLLETSTENLDRVATVASLFGFGAFIRPFTNALAQFAAGFSNIMDQAARLIVPYNNTIITATSEMQRIFHLGMFAVVPDVYQEVVAANDPDIELSDIWSVASALDFINEYNELLERFQNPQVSDQGSNSGDTKLRRFEDFSQVTLEGADNFTRSRHRSAWFWPIRQRGGSEFQRRAINNQYVYDWTALDTVALNFRFGPFFSVNIPIGYGAAHALNQNDGTSPFFDYSSNRFRGYDWGESGGAWSNRTSAFIAQAVDGRNNISRGETIRPFYDLESDELIDTGPDFIFVLQKGAGATRVWRAVADDLPNYELQDDLDIAENGGLTNDRMLSVSKSEVYFARAHDLWGLNNGQAELGNMFNPFWQPRLSKLTNTEKTALLLLETGLGL